jgi:hypothetical protein
MTVRNLFCAWMVVIMTICNATALWPLQKAEGIVNNELSTHDFFGSLGQFRVPDLFTGSSMQVDVKELPESIEIQVRSLILKVSTASFFPILISFMILQFI